MTGLQCLKCKNISQFWETDFKKKEKSTLILRDENLNVLDSPTGKILLNGKSISFQSYFDILKNCKSIKTFYYIISLTKLENYHFMNYLLKNQIKEDIFDYYELNKIQIIVLNELCSINEFKEQFLAYTNIENKEKILRKLHYLFH